MDKYVHYVAALRNRDRFPNVIITLTKIAHWNVFCHYRGNIRETVYIFCQAFANVEEETTRRKRVRNRWYKTVTLINNPTLVFERLLKIYQQEMELAGGDEDERLRLKVITKLK